MAGSTYNKGTPFSLPPGTSTPYEPTDSFSLWAKKRQAKIDAQPLVPAADSFVQWKAKQPKQTKAQSTVAVRPAVTPTVAWHDQYENVMKDIADSATPEIRQQKVNYYNSTGQLPAFAKSGINVANDLAYLGVTPKPAGGYRVPGNGTLGPSIVNDVANYVKGAIQGGVEEAKQSQILNKMGQANIASMDKFKTGLVPRAGVTPNDLKYQQGLEQQAASNFQDQTLSLPEMIAGGAATAGVDPLLAGLGFTALNAAQGALQAPLGQKIKGALMGAVPISRDIANWPQVQQLAQTNPAGAAADVANDALMSLIPFGVGLHGAGEVANRINEGKAILNDDVNPFHPVQGLDAQDQLNSKTRGYRAATADELKQWQNEKRLAAKQNATLQTTHSDNPAEKAQLGLRLADVLRNGSLGMQAWDRDHAGNIESRSDLKPTSVSHYQPSTQPIPILTPPDETTSQPQQPFVSQPGQIILPPGAKAVPDRGLGKTAEQMVQDQKIQQHIQNVGGYQVLMPDGAVPETQTPQIQLAKQVGGGARQEVQPQGYETLRDDDKRLADILNHHEKLNGVTANDILNELIAEKDRLIKEYAQILIRAANDAKGEPVTIFDNNNEPATTQLNGKIVSKRNINGQYKWADDVARQFTKKGKSGDVPKQNWSELNQTEKREAVMGIPEKGIPGVAEEQLRKGNTDKYYGDTVDPELVEHFNDVEDGIDALKKASPELKRATPKSWASKPLGASSAGIDEAAKDFAWFAGNKSKAPIEAGDRFDDWKQQRDAGQAQTVAESIRTPEVKAQPAEAGVESEAAPQTVEELSRQFKKVGESERPFSVEKGTNPAPYGEDIQGMPKGSMPEKSANNFEGEAEGTVSKQDLINKIRELFGPLRTGRTKAGLAGQFDSRQGVMRTAGYGDIPTITHELGHNIDKALGLSDSAKDNPAIEKELTTAGKFTASADATPDYIHKEGVAEFLRQKMTDPSMAEKNFPEFSKYFDAKMAENPDVKKALDGVAGIVKTWYTQDPYARANVVFKRTKTGLQKAWGVIKTPRDWARQYKLASSKLYTNLFDSNNVLNAFQETLEARIGQKLTGEADLKTKVRLANDSVIGLSEHLIGGKDKNPGDTEYILKKLFPNIISKGVRTLADILRGLNFKSDEEYEKFAKFLAAKHQTDIAAEGMKTGMDQLTMQQIVNDAPQPWHKAAAEITRLHDFIGWLLVDSGYWDKESYLKMKNKWPNYVPQYRDFDEGVPRSISLDKAMRGGEDPVLDPIQMTAEKIRKAVRTANRNVVLRSFVKIAEHPDLGDLIEKVDGPASSRDLSFTVHVEGKPQTYIVGDKDVYDAIKSVWHVNPDAMGWLGTVMSFFANTLRAGAVAFNPPFAMYHMSRDIVGAAVYGKRIFPIVDNVEGLIHLLSNERITQEFKVSGAASLTRSAMDRGYQKFLIENIYEKSKMQKLTTVLNPMTYVEAIHSFVNAALQAPKLMEFKRGLEAGEDYQTAAMTAKEITIDPTRGGKRTKKWNKYVPFLNVAFQGVDLLARHLVDPKTRGRTLFKATMAITVPTIACWLLNHNDKRYQEVPQIQKDLFWIIPTPDFLIRVPKPLTLGFPFGSVVERALNYIYNKDPDAWKDWEFSHTFIPPAIAPFLSCWANKDIWNGSPVVPASEANLEPAEQYGPQTSEIAKFAGKELGKAGMGVSPRYIDNFITDWFGGVGQEAGDLVDQGLVAAGVKKDTTPEKEWWEEPGVNRFTITPGRNSQSVDDFYTNLKDATMKYDTAKKLHQPIPADVSRSYHKYLRAEKIMSAYSKKIRNIMESENISPANKRRMLDELDQKRIDFARKFLGRDQ